MTSLEKRANYASSPIRGPGDGMETEQPAKTVEVIAEVHTTNRHARHSPHRKAISSLSPGVLQLGKIHNNKSVEIEAVRILVPKAAITHVVPTKNAKVAKSLGHHKGEDFSKSGGVTESNKEFFELKNAVEKLKNSERRLLQDKEGLSNQLHVQTEVNRELKKLLIASVGDDLQYHFERMAREKNQLILENEALGRNVCQLSEQLERMSIQCDVWRSKFLASRVMADELTNARATLQRQTRDAQSAIQDMLSERDQFRQEMIDTQKLLEELLVSLQWGRQQTYYPSAQPHSTAELAAVNHKLAKAVKSHLLGNVGTNTPKKTPPSTEFCNTPAEKMAEMVLRVLDPTASNEASPEVSFSEPSSPSFLSTKKNIEREREREREQTGPVPSPTHAAYLVLQGSCLAWSRWQRGLLEGNPNDKRYVQVYWSRFPTRGRVQNDCSESLQQHYWHQMKLERKRESSVCNRGQLTGTGKGHEHCEMLTMYAQSG